MLGEVPTGREMLGAFRGLNRTPAIAPDEFADMMNLTGAAYPTLTPRAARGFVRQLAKPNGVFAHGALGWVDGPDLYYDGVLRGQVADSPKRFVLLGARVLIWPDKLAYNTETHELTALEARVTTTGAVSYTLCRADGSAAGTYSASTTAPSSPEDGQLWVDTSIVPNVLKQFSKLKGIWVSMPVTTVKISAPGIGASFATGDGVKITDSKHDALNTDTVLMGAAADYLLVTGIIGTADSQTDPLTVERAVPDMDYLTEHHNRVWGCSSTTHEIYASKQGDPCNWRCYQGVASDSYAVTVGSPGDFTGACTHQGTVFFFKDNRVIKIFGTKPSNFELVDQPARGVQAGCADSIAVVRETLHYVSRGGVSAMGMALPQAVGAALGPGPYLDAVAGAADDRYYVSMREAGGGWALYVCDTARGLWHREDDTRVLAFVLADGVLYGLRADGWLYTVDGSQGPYATAEAHTEGRYDWMAETGDIGISSPDMKVVSKLTLRLTIAPGALVKVWLKYDHAGEWRDVYRMNPNVQRSYSVPIIPRRCDTMRIRLTGRGGFALHTLTKTMQEGGEV